MRRALAAALLAAASARGADFHVSLSGDDASPGTAAQPWRTLARVNAESFGPGDRILLEGGQVHAGTLELGADDTGTAASPIVVSSYGAGRATLDAGAEKGISIYNTAGVEIRGLVVRGGWDAATQSGNGSSGIELYMDLPGTTKLEHVVVEDVEVSGFRSAGITMGAWPSDATMGGFRGVRLERCDSHDNAGAGIAAWGYWDPSSTEYSHEDLVIRYCRAFRNRGIVGHAGHSGNGIVIGGVRGALIERCEAHENGDLCDHRGGGPVGIWCWDSDRVTIQHCESHHNRTGAVSLDGGGFDLDGGTTNSVLQYNWSHDNDGAGILVYQFYGARPSLSGNVVRYNLSQDDGRQHGYGGIYVGDGSAAGGEVHDNVFHGNTIFVSPSGHARTSGITLDRCGAGNRFLDNAVMATGGLALVSSDRSYSRGSVAFHGNLWWSGPGAFRVDWAGTTMRSLGEWRAAGQETFGPTPTGLEADPLFTSPGGGATVGDCDALATMDAYVPLAGSPLVDAGLDLETLFGVDPGPRDFLGTAVPQGAALDVGAVELGAPCSLPPAVAGTLRVRKPAGELLFTWEDVAGADGYVVREDLARPPAFATVTGTATTGSTGLRVPLPAGRLIHYKVAGTNPCGEGPR